MTAKASTSNFLTNFKYRVKSNTRIMVIVFILHLMAAPLNLIYLIYYQQKQALWEAERLIEGGPVTSYVSFNYMYPVIGVICTALAVLSGILLAVNIYNYLYKRSVVDMTLSLPLTTDQRFFSDFLAGLFTYLAPFVVSSALSLLINGVAGALIPKWNEIQDLNVTQSLLSAIVIGFFIMLMVYVLTLLVLACCGSLFETLAYTIMVNGLIPGTIAVFGYILMGNLYGLDLSSSIMPLIEKTSPIGALIGIFYNVDRSGLDYLPLRLSWLIPFVLVTFLYFCTAYFLYKNRKAEQVSRPFVYKAFYFVIITSLTFCIGTLFTMDSISENLIPLIIITAVIYLIFEVVTNRGFRKFYKSVIRYVVTVIAVLGLSQAFDYFEGFGAVQRIPAAADVQSVEMNYSGIFNKFSYYLTNTPLVYSDPKNIEAIVNMHREVLDNYSASITDGAQASTDEYNTRAASVYFNTLKLKYRLKNGQSFIRQYSVSFDEYIKLLSVDSTEEFKNNYIQSIQAAYNRYTDKTMTLSSSLSYYESSDIRPDIHAELLQALFEDIRALPIQEYLTPSQDTLGYLSVSPEYNSRISLNDNYPNTLMCLKKYGIQLPTGLYDLDQLQLVESSKDLFMYPPELSKLSVDGTNYYYSNANRSMYVDVGAVTPEISQDLVNILTHLQADYLTTEPCYTLFISGVSYIVPPEYTWLAESVYKSAEPLVFEDETDKEVYYGGMVEATEYAY